MSVKSSTCDSSQPLRFWRRGEIVCVSNVTPERTLLELLREDLRACDTKEGCAAGDCGACTVVVADSPDGEHLNYRAINSCIRPAHAIDGLALWTAADLPSPDGTLHPVQQALVDQHATQCGFCTPGFVMSLFSLYQRTVARGRAPTETEIHDALSGNLCRCTGYRAILDAARQLGQMATALAVPGGDESTLARQLRTLPARDNAQADYALPTTLNELLQLRASRPEAQLIAGATDAGLWITQGLQRMPSIIDLTRVQALRAVERYPHHLAIGAAVPLQEAFEALAQDRPAITAFAQRFAGWPIRQSGTLAGNVANGSPIGDAMPLLLALDAHLVLMAWRDGRQVHRELPLADFYTGYRQNVMAPDEVLAWIKVAHPQRHEWLGLYKIAKRVEDDISAVCLALRIEAEGGQLHTVRIGVGGVAATPARALQTESVMQGQPDEARIWTQARDTLAGEFSPLSDLRASSHYRRRVLHNLMERARLERLGKPHIRLETLA